MVTRKMAGATAAPERVGGPLLEMDGLRGYFQSRRAGLDARLATRLVEFIDGTRDALDCAIYDLRHPDVLAALRRLAARGARLRIAFDAGAERTGGLSADPKPNGTRQALADAGLLAHATPVHERGRHLMHLKFLVRDGRAIWVGSANFTRGGLELQDNTCLEVASPELAAAFGATFEDLLRPAHRHASAGAQSAPAAPVRVGDAALRPLFAPAAGEGIEDVIVAALRGARKVRVLAFLLSDPGILAALAPLAADPRADLRGVYDPHGMQDVLRYTRPKDRARFWFLHDPRFVAAPSHAFSPGREQDFMHNKALIIDDRLVITGSYNFSENAEANDEVVLAIESPEVAAAYTGYFDALHAAYGAPARGARDPLGAAPRAHVEPRSVRAARTDGAPTRAARAVRNGARGRAGGTGRGGRAGALDLAVVALAVLAVAVAIALVVVLVAGGIVHP